MKLFAYLQLLHGILNKTIDEIQAKVADMSEEDMPDEDKLDVSAFDLIISTITNMKSRYLEFKSEVESDPTQQEAIRSLRLVVNQDEPEDDSGNNGGLH